VKLASRELNDFIAFSYFMAPENAKICQVLQAELQCEEAGNYFYSLHQN
jgi:hypothetical protein